jgi:hypothetical protein
MSVEHRVPFFMKQMGSNPTLDGVRLKLSDRAGADPAEWPEDLRLRQMPNIYDMVTA